MNHPRIIIGFISLQNIKFICFQLRSWNDVLFNGRAGAERIGFRGDEQPIFEGKIHVCV